MPGVLVLLDIRDNNVINAARKVRLLTMTGRHTRPLPSVPFAKRVAFSLRERAPFRGAKGDNGGTIIALPVWLPWG